MKKGIVLIIAIVIVIAIGIVYKVNENNYFDEVNESYGVSPSWVSPAWVFHTTDIEELVNYADTIVIGQVKDYKPTDEYFHIQTIQTIKVVESLKGDFKRTDKIDVLVYGGKLYDYVYPPFEGCPLMDKRSDYLLFLTKNPDDDIYTIVSGNQGFARISGDEIVIDKPGEVEEKIMVYSVDDFIDLVTELK